MIKSNQPIGYKNGEAVGLVKAANDLITTSERHSNSVTRKTWQQYPDFLTGLTIKES